MMMMQSRLPSVSNSEFFSFRFHEERSVTFYNGACFSWKRESREISRSLRLRFIDPTTPLSLSLPPSPFTLSIPSPHPSRHRTPEFFSRKSSSSFLDRNGF
ncbi:hypothetical protein CEXT_66761 [Caerostris extrusa]|uniref:Uncharacterized protein n=1 Tax=Caerostris extrusa TaxID=172846 RepID=A0AAV4MGB2_CAEEX|nr:hypothetical protein CEXT_66761 [Caerostris extrusa]